MNGTLENVGERPALRFERRLTHPVERVWRAVTDPTELAQWFVAPVAWTPEQGERFESLEQPGEIVELEAPSRIVWIWGGERFGFEPRPDGDGCVIVFTHVFDDREPGAQHAAGWELYLGRLDSHLAGLTFPRTSCTRPCPRYTIAMPSGSGSTRRPGGARSPTTPGVHER